MAGIDMGERRKFNARPMNLNELIKWKPYRPIGAAVTNPSPFGNPRIKGTKSHVRQTKGIKNPTVGHLNFSSSQVY